MMDPMGIRRAVLELIVRQSLHEMKGDPRRGIRNLVDLGREVSGGRIQDRFLNMIQQTLKGENSPYYDMVQRIVNQADLKRLLKFGVNLGWNSLTQGTKCIRTLEEKKGCHIPWSLIFHMEAGKDSLEYETYFRVIREGMAAGIYNYVIFAADIRSVHMAVRLAADSQECAFWLLLPEAFFAEGQAEELIRCANILPGIYGQGSELEEGACQLRRRKIPYFIYRCYTNQEDVEEIVSTMGRRNGSIRRAGDCADFRWQAAFGRLY